MLNTFYELFVGLSAVLFLVFMLQWRKNASLEYMFTFVLVPVVNLGYVWLAKAKNLEEALLAQKLIYIGGCFLHLFLLMGIFSVCNIKLKSWAKTIMLFAAFIMYGGVLTMGSKPYFYKSVKFVLEGETGTLVKEYGPLHTVFYVYMIAILIASISVLVYAMLRRPDTSLRNLYILIILDIISVTVFFGEKAISKSLGFNVEIMPAFFVLAELVFVIIFHRIRLYDISSGIAENLLEEGQNGIICFDKNKRYLVANDTAKKILPSLKLAKADTHLNRSTKEYEVILNTLDYFSHSEIISEPYTLEIDDKIYEILPDYMYEGKIKRGYYLLLMDVTKDRLYAKKLQEAANEAISAEKAKSSFLAQMSHEIRTPINAVLGMNEMILREAKDDEILDYAESIQSSGKTLLLLINSILDFSKIESGKMEIVPVKYRTADMIENCLNSVLPRAGAKSIIVNKEIDSGLPSGLYGDDVRVGQVILNLLTNAIKYTEKGSVTLSIKELTRFDDGIQIRVEVRDTGIGIKPEDMSKLFESFGRIDVKRNRNIEGTGLGMSIVTALLEMMNSKLEVESEYGKGSCFSFNLYQEISDATPIGNFRMRETEKKKTEKPELTKFPGKEILVVDDNSMNLKVASRFLKLSEINADTALSGYEAIELVRKKKYDIVFLDHMMPKMDGIETLLKMKEMNIIDSSTKVIALTANAITGAKETYINAGFDDYMSKPIDIKNLEELLIKFLT